MTVGGNVYARAFNGDATGVAVTTSESAAVNVYGNVSAIGYGNATGVSVLAKDGGVKGYVGGNVYAGAYNGNATGVSVVAIAAFVDIAGNVTAKSQYGNATGVYIYDAEIAEVTVGGDVHASSAFSDATGVYAKSVKGYLRLAVGGNVVVTGYAGATGVKINNAKGYSVVDVTGEISAYTKNGGAYGVDTIGAANIMVGGVSAIGKERLRLRSRCAYTRAWASINLDVTGDVYARAYDGAAIGVFVTVGEDYNFTGAIGGNVTAIADYEVHGVQITRAARTSPAFTSAATLSPCRTKTMQQAPISSRVTPPALTSTAM